MFGSLTINTQEVTPLPNTLLDNFTCQNTSGIVWGRLYGKRLNIKSIDLCDENFSVGRGKTNSLTIDENALNGDFLLKISKTHFIISRENNDVLAPVYILDHSLNGTFVNGELIGNKKKRILQNDDIISLSYPHCKAFVFKDLGPSYAEENPKEIREKYYVNRRLGAGAGGFVYLVYNRRTCVKYAMKQVKKNILKEIALNNIHDSERIMNEAKIMKRIQHPCILKLHEILEKPDSVYMILEYMAGGDLLTRIITKKRLTEEISKLFFYQMCQAVKYLHENGITHRDLKPDNVLVETQDEETLVKVSDFGLSKFVSGDSVLKTVCGTPLYVAPEVLSTNGKGTYTKKCDIWSLGVVLFTCLSGTLPFSSEYGSPACEQIKNGEFRFSHSSWKNVSSSAKELINRMLTVDHNKRPSIDYIICHEWLQDTEVIRKAHKLMKTSSSMENESFLEPPLKRIKH